MDCGAFERGLDVLRMLLGDDEVEGDAGFVPRPAETRRVLESAAGELLEAAALGVEVVVLGTLLGVGLGAGEDALVEEEAAVSFDAAEATVGRPSSARLANPSGIGAFEASGAALVTPLP